MPVIRAIREGEMPLLRRLLDAYLLEYDPTEDPARYWDDAYMAACQAGLTAGTLAILLVWNEAIDDEEPIGCAIARIERHWYRASGSMGIVEEFYIASAHRRHGHGRALAERAFAELRRMGATSITAHVLRENRQALLFWQRIGLTIEVYQLFLRAT